MHRLLKSICWEKSSWKELTFFLTFSSSDYKSSCISSTEDGSCLKVLGLGFKKTLGLMIELTLLWLQFSLLIWLSFILSIFGGLIYWWFFYTFNILSICCAWLSEIFLMKEPFFPFSFLLLKVGLKILADSAIILDKHREDSLFLLLSFMLFYDVKLFLFSDSSLWSKLTVSFSAFISILFIYK